MIIFNSRYSSAVSKRVLRPRITIAMHFADDGSDIVYFTSHDDIGRPSGGGVQAVDGCIENFNAATQKIDPKNNTASIGSVSFSLVDLEFAISEILEAKHADGKSPRGKKLEVYYGFGPYLMPSDGSTPGSYETLDWLDYELAFTMIVKNYDVGPGMYTFTAEDVQRLEQPDLFIPDVTTLRETITPEQMFIPINENIGTTKFQTVAHDATYTNHPSATRGYVRIDDEIICHSGVVNDGTYGVSLAVVERGSHNTTPAGHQADPDQPVERRTKIEEFIYLEGPALKILYAIQTGILYGQGGATLPDHWHQGISTDFVRLTDYLNADPMLWEPVANTGRKLRFEGLKKENGENFISSQILAWIGGIRPVYRDGAIGFKKLSSVLSGSDYIYELNDSNIVSIGTLSYNLDDVINEISVSWNWSFLKETFLQNTGLIDINSIAKYGRGDSRRFEFYGVTSINQTSQDLFNIFNGYRNRYAGGGYSIECELMPKVHGLEVGDIIRLTTNKIRDPLTNAALDRNFEIQQITPSSKTGRMRVALFASTEAAGQFEEITDATVMDDTFYASGGGNIAGLPGVTGGAITSNLTLTGGSTMGAGIYYYLGNLTINSGVTLTIQNNVQLRVRGFLQVNGSINGLGAGRSGGVGGTLFTENSDTEIGVEFPSLTSGELVAELYRHLVTKSEWTETNQTAGGIGFFGASPPANSTRIQISGTDWVRGWVFSETPTPGRAIAADQLPLVNRDGLELEGVDALDLRGSGGDGARPLIRGWAFGGTYEIAQNGTNGGAGGAGLIIICRGMGFGASGNINLSGADGTAAAAITNDVYGAPGTMTLHNGGGGGGGAGAFYLFIDGNNVYDAFTESNLIQNRGKSGLNEAAELYTPASQPIVVNASDEWTASEHESLTVHFGRAINPDVAMGRAGYNVQYIPPVEGLSDGGVIDAPPYQLRPITGLTLTTGTDELLGSKDGTIRERIRVTFTETADTQVDAYEVQAKEDAETDWRTVAVVTEPRAYFDVTELITYDVRVRAVSYAANVESSDWVTDSIEALGKSLPPSDPVSFQAFVLPDGVTVQIGQHPDADFLEWIIEEDGFFAYRGAGSLMNIGFRSIGAHTYTITARDRSGNLSAGTLSDSVTIARPLSPSVTVSYDGENFRFDIGGAVQSYALKGYSIVLGATEIAFVNSSVYIAKVDWVGSRSFYVRALDMGGNYSLVSTLVTVTPTGPGIPAVTAEAIDNNVTLRYRSTPGSLPILKYEIYKGATFAGATLYDDKAGDSSFTIIQENTGGDYTYWFLAYDTAGNVSSESGVTVRVSQPPDYVFYAGYDERALGYDGTITNGIVNSNEMILMVNSSETWSSYEGNGYSTFQAENDAGFTLYAMPGTTSGIYEKTYDLGVMIGAATVVMNISQTQTGTVTSLYEIEYSDDDITYTTVTGTQAFATDFQYIRIRLTYTGTGNNELVVINNIIVQLSLKEQGESGRITANSGDVGGTTVTFSKSWLDVTSIIVTPNSTTARYAVFDFTDVPNPTDFAVYLFDDTGARVTGEVSYSVRGYLSN